MSKSIFDIANATEKVFPPPLFKKLSIKQKQQKKQNPLTKRFDSDKAYSFAKGFDNNNPRPTAPHFANFQLHSPAAPRACINRFLPDKFSRQLRTSPFAKPRAKTFSLIASLSLLLTAALFFSCSHKSDETKLLESQLLILNQMQKSQKATGAKLFALNSKTAATLIALGREDEAILFLENVVNSNPADKNSPYYLLMIAFSYMRQDSTPLAEYYFERILNDYDDLLIKGQSVHYISLQNLIKICHDPKLRIKYLKELATNYARTERVTELHLRIALEYEKLNEWEKALAEYELFLKQPDSASIQIMDEPNAYKRARQLVGYSKSSRDWTYPSLDELKRKIQTAIRQYDWRTLDKCKAKVNFFSMSWKQDEIDPNAQEEFSMRGFMRGQRINFENNFDKDSNAFEAYLRTWGWSQYVSVWYFYFRKVDYPVDPNINGNWEWAGIYMGEKL